MSKIDGPMRWFWAWTVLMTVKKRDFANPRAITEVWKNLILVQARNADEAYEKACDIGRMSNGDGDGNLTLWDAPARTEFLGISDLGVIHDKLEDGCEILWQLRKCTGKTARALVRSKIEICKEVARELKGSSLA